MTTFIGCPLLILAEFSPFTQIFSESPPSLKRTKQRVGEINGDDTATGQDVPTIIVDPSSVSDVATSGRIPPSTDPRSSTRTLSAAPGQRHPWMVNQHPRVL
jgi:hypothetical protein